MKKCQLQHLLFLFIFPWTLSARFMIEPCTSSDSCTSLLYYVLPFDSKLVEIAYRFQVNITDILAANSINPTPPPSINNQIFHANSLFKIPISCQCVDGIRRSTSTRYTVRAADSVDSISEGYGRLVSGEQIRSNNGINAKNPLTIGQTLVIPLPCTCFNNSNNGIPAVYMSYVVRAGESLGSIAMEFGTTVVDLEAVNGLSQLAIDPGDILAIPVSACSSANLNWYNETLIVPNGSYALTANNCIKCFCDAANLNLRCLPSGIEFDCSHLQCKRSDLYIGDIHVTHTAIGCNIVYCAYRGHSGRKIFRSLVNATNVQCPGNQSFAAASPLNNPVVPSLVLPPLLSPSAAPSPVIGSDNGFDSRNRHKSNISDGGDLRWRIPPWFSLLLLEIMFNYILYF